MRGKLHLRLVLATTSLALAAAAVAQVTAPAIPPEVERERARITAASEAERQRELALLGITAMQPPANARDPQAPNFANYEEARANPYPIPPLLVAADGTGVRTAEQWWSKRRPELVAMLDKEVYGRVPPNVPGVSWRVSETVRERIGSHDVVTKKLVGHVNGPATGPQVDLLMNLSTPDGRSSVPVVMTIGSVRPRPAGLPAPPPATGPDWREQLLAKGWGFATIDTASIQADNGAGLNEGIIGLVNGGRPRSLDDWGVLRAWAWGASRGLDHLQTDGDVNGKAVAIYGHSRTGKAAIVALAYDQRFATGFISSSGAGGANLYRRNFGEPIANLVSTAEYHWFAGNFLKYGAVGHNATELSTDAHALVAMVAPRPLFIGAGVLISDPPSAFPGDGWVDAQGMFISASAATPVWRLLGKTGLETSDFPAITTYLGRGEIGFRQHTEGHTPAPNWAHFITHASAYLR